MATKPGAPAHPSAHPPTHPVAKASAFNETAIAIGGALLLSLVLSTIFFSNPLHALRLAYIDYSHTPATGAREASDTRAPLTQPDVKADENAAATGVAPAPAAAGDKPQVSITPK